MSKSSSSSSNLRLSVGSGAPVRVHKVRDDELTKLRELFAKHDKDNSHSIDQHELEGLLAEWTEEERPEDRENVLYIAQELMQRIDTDGNGYITFVEFLRGFKILHDIIETEAVKHPTKARLAKLAAGEGSEDAPGAAPIEDEEDEGDYVEIVDRGGSGGGASSERHEKETNTEEEEEGGGSRHPHHDTIVRELQEQIVGLQHMQQEVKDLQADKEEMKKAHQTERDEFAARESDYKSRLEALQKDMNEMKSLHDKDVSTLQHQLDTMKGARDDADKNYERVNAQLLELRDSHDKLVQHAAEADASSSKYMEQLRDERDQFSSLIKGHEDTQKKDKEKMSELAARISELEANIQKSNEETEQMRKDVVQKEEDNKTKIQTLEATLEEVIKERDHLRVRFVVVEEQIHQAAEKKMRDQQTQATNEIERLTTSLNKNEQEYNRLKKVIDDYASDKKTWEDAQKNQDALRNEHQFEIEATLVKMKQEKEQNEEKHKQEKGEMEATIQRLKDDKNNQKQATAILLEKVRKEVEEEFGRRASVAEADSKVLMEDMKKASGNLDHLRDTFEKEVSTLKAEIDSKIKQNAEYRDQSEQQLLFLQSANDRLKDEITQKQQSNVSFSRRVHDLEEDIHKGRVEYDDLQKVTRDLETRLTQARDEVAQSRRDAAAGLATSSLSAAKPQMHNIHTYYFVAGGFVGAVIGLSLRYIFK